MWDPRIYEKSSNGIRESSIYSILLKQRKAFLLGEIDADLAEGLTAELLYLSSEDPVTPIQLYINSTGGEIQSGLLIVDTMLTLPAPVETICLGLAASMAAVILSCGQAGRRTILPHGRTMIHEPLLAGSFGGSATSIQNISESIINTKNIINTILAEHTGHTKEEIDAATSFDNYMNAMESSTFGLCDSITGIDGKPIGNISKISNITGKKGEINGYHLPQLFKQI